MVKLLTMQEVKDRTVALSLAIEETIAGCCWGQCYKCYCCRNPNKKEEENYQCRLEEAYIALTPAYEESLKRRGLR